MFLHVRTDGEGRFSLRGVPPSEREVTLDIAHPDYQVAHARRVASTTPESPLVVRMTPGCIVAGVVVDERGRPVVGAWAQIRKPSVTGYELNAHSDAEGRFRFGDVSPGRWDLVVEPERHAPALVRIVADPARPVADQVVVLPGAYIGGKVVGPDGQPVEGAAVGWAESTDAESGLIGLNRMTQTAADGTFRLGPLPPGEVRITGLAQSPRRLGKVVARANQADALIRLEPDPLDRARR
jgi:hypothetical protein